MFTYVAGLATGCLIGVCCTILLLLLSAALTDEYPHELRKISLLQLAATGTGIFAVAYSAYYMNFEKSAAALLLLLAVLGSAKIGGLVNGFISAALAAGMLCVLFLPPIGSLRIAEPSDRFVLSLFLITAALGSRLVGRTRELASQRQQS